MPKKEGAQSASGKQIRNIRNDVTSCGPRHCRPHESQGSGRCGVSDMRRERDLRVAPSVARLLLCVVALASVRESEGLANCVAKADGSYVPCTDLVNGTSTATYITTKSEYELFSFDLPADTDATLTLTVNDGDADLYVYGPGYAKDESLPGPSYFEWRSHHAVGDDVVHVSRYDEGGNPSGTYKVGVWGWSIRSKSDSGGTSWKLQLDLQSSEVNNTAAQKAAMELVYDECCNATGGTSPGSGSAATGGPDADNPFVRCSAWKEKGKEGTDFCHMRGSMCNSAGELTHLHLAGFGLKCELPVLALQPVLQTVHRLDISSNPDLKGGANAANTFMALSSTYAPNMTHFHASYSPVFRSDDGTTNTFPDAVCLALPSTLISVRISRTGAKGVVPDCMIQSHLRELEMSFNDISGQMPGPYNADANNPSEIEVFIADGCKLMGNIPSEWADHAPKLNVFTAKNNELTGPIPAFKEVTMDMIRLPGNLLTGSIPNSLASLSSLQELNLEDNQLTGSIPEGLFSGSYLRYAYLDDNALSGTMPSQTAYGAKLRFLDVRNNALEGDPLPNVLLDAPALLSYKAGGNMFSAELPTVTEYDEATQTHTLTKLKELRVLDLSDNKMYGSAPASYEHLVVIDPGDKGYLLYNNGQPYVHVLDLSSNQLTGEIPSWSMPPTGQWMRFYDINITDNNWACPIPENIDIEGLTCVDDDGRRRDRFGGVVLADGTVSYLEEPRKKPSGFFEGKDSLGWSVVVLIMIIVIVVYTMASIRNYVKRKMYPRDEDEENFSGPMARMDGLELTDVGIPPQQEGANRPRMTSRGMPLFND